MTNTSAVFCASSRFIVPPPAGWASATRPLPPPLAALEPLRRVAIGRMNHELAAVARAMRGDEVGLILFDEPSSGDAHGR